MGELTRTRPDRDCEPRLVDYERERASYVVSVPERFNAVEAIVDTWAADDPDAPALLSARRRRRGRRARHRRVPRRDVA